MAGILYYVSKLFAIKRVYQPKLAASKKCIPAKIGCQPKANTSQMLVLAKSCYKPKMAACRMWLPAKCQCNLKSCRNAVNENI